jgi:prepilin-type processing-associated H-X9-DG protein
MPGPMHYVGIAGVGADAPSLATGHPRDGIFGYDRQTRMVDIADGTSTTMMLAETTFANGPWTAGGPATVRGLDQGRQPYLGLGRQFGGAHPGGAMVAFADGSVRFLPETIAPTVFEAIATIAGGEVIAERWDR